MEFIVILVLILIIVISVLVSIKFANFKNRIGQEVFKGTEFSESNINSNIMGGFEKKYMSTFLEEQTSYTEDTFKDLMLNYSQKLINNNLTGEFSSKILEKAPNDRKLQNFQSMKFVRVNLNYYKDTKLRVDIVYADQRDEYNLLLFCNIENGVIPVDNYQISKGAALGF